MHEVPPLWILGVLTDREKLAWAAGFFDGEGSVAINDNGLMIKAGQINVEPLYILQGIFGGRINEDRSAARQGYRRFHLWMASTRQAADALRQMFPYLTVKKNAALVALQHQSLITPGRTQRLTDAEKQERLRLRALLKKINGLDSDEAQGFMSFGGITTYWEMDRDLDATASTAVEYV